MTAKEHSQAVKWGTFYLHGGDDHAASAAILAAYAEAEMALTEQERRSKLKVSDRDHILTLP